jgi:hypothetical protein
MKALNISVAMLSLLFIMSCGEDDKTDTKPDNECGNKVESRNDSIIITGKCDFETDITFPSPSYVLTISEKSAGNLSNLEIFQTAFNSYMGVKASSASALRDDGWYSQAGVWEKINGTWKWRVKATGEYRVVFAKLPLQKTPATVPVTYAMSGQAVLGPIHLNGSHTFNVSCPDAKLAGFTAELYNGNNGDEILNTSYHNILDVINLDEDNKQINNYSKTIQLDIPEGNYIMKVSSNSNAAWTVSVN